MRKAKTVIVTHTDYRELVYISVSTYNNTRVTLFDNATTANPRAVHYSSFSDLYIAVLNILKENGFYCKKQEDFGLILHRDIVFINVGTAKHPHRTMFLSKGALK